MTQQLPGNLVPIRDQQTGAVRMVDPTLAQELLLTGGGTGSTYEPVSGADQRELEQRAYANTMLGEAETLGRGALDALGRPVVGAVGYAMGAEGPMPGVSSMIEGGLAELGGASPLEAGRAIGESQQLGETLAAQNPFAAGAGEIIGSSLPFAFGPGAAIGEAAVARLGSAALTGAGRKLAGYAVQGAVEGAVDAAGRELSANPQASASRILSQVGMGALLGGTAGAALPAAGMAVGGAARKAGQGAMAAGKAGLDAIQALRPKVAGEIADAANEAGMTGGFRSMLVDASAASLAVPRQLVDEVGHGGALAEAAELASRTRGEVVDKAAQRLGERFDRTHKMLEEVTDTSRIATKKVDSFRRQTDEAVLRDPARIAAMRDIGRQTRDELAAIEAEIAGAVEAGLISRKGAKSFMTSKRELDEALLGTIGNDPDSLEYALPVELFKRKAQRAVVDMRSTAEQAFNANNISAQELRRSKELINRFEAVQERARQALENPDLVGEPFATAQREINGIWAGGAIEALTRFREAFMRPIGNLTDYGTGRRLYEIDPAKLKASLSSRGAAEGVISGRALDKYLGNIGDLAEAHARNYGDDLGEAYIEKASGLAREMREATTDVEGIIAHGELADKYDTLKAAESSRGVLGSGAALVGGFLGGIPGALAGGAISAVLRPTATSAAAVHLAGLARRANLSGQAVRKWISSGAAKAKSAGALIAGGVTPEGRRAAKVTGQAVRAGIVSAAVRNYYGDAETPAEKRDRYRKRLKDLERWQPGRVADAMNQDGTVPPQVAQAIAQKEAEVRAYLLERAPSAKYAGAVRPGIPYAPSEAEQETFARQVGTALQPSSAVDDLQAGVATPEQMTVLQDLYPDYYASVKLGAIQGLSDADADGIRIPLHQRAYLDAMLGLNGAGDPALSQEFAMTVSGELAAQDEQAAQAPQQPQSSSGGSMATTPAMNQFSMA